MSEVRKRRSGAKKSKIVSPQATSEDEHAGFWSATATSQLSSGDRKERVRGRRVQGGENEEVMGIPDVPGFVRQDAPPKGPRKWGDFFIRLVTGMGMVFGFVATVWCGHIAVLGLVVLLQMALYKEISHLRKDPEKEKKLRYISVTRWYFFLVMMVYGHGRALTPQILRFALRHGLSHQSPAAHEFICFVLYSLGIVGFVLTLRKGHFKYQFGTFAWTHMTLILIILQTTWMSANVFSGLIWLVLPAFLVICNDTMAYMCGRAFGRTPLIRLSPKKTVEGFLGATVCTVVFGVIFAELLSRYPHMYCPKQHFDFSGVECVPPPAFQWTTRPVTTQWLLSAGVTEITFRPMYYHAVVLALFASLIGPFGGFFASGIKRALKKKDFGDLFPGHGGVTDRFDCQILMAAFVFFYLRSVVSPQLAFLSVEQLFQTAVTLPLPDQVRLYQQMTEALQAAGALP